METIAQAKQYLFDHRETGVVCPCCDQFVKLYRRKLSSAMAVGLIKLVRLHLAAPGWYHVTDIGVTKSGGEFAQLAHWRLIAPEINTDTAKRTSGMWTPTGEGIRFAQNKIMLSRYVFLLNGEPRGFSEETTTIVESLGNRFNYAELMGVV